MLYAAFSHSIINVNVGSDVYVKSASLGVVSGGWYDKGPGMPGAKKGGEKAGYLSRLDAR